MRRNEALTFCFVSEIESVLKSSYREMSSISNWSCRSWREVKVGVGSGWKKARRERKTAPRRNEARFVDRSKNILLGTRWWVKVSEETGREGSQLLERKKGKVAASSVLIRFPTDDRSNRVDIFFFETLPCRSPCSRVEMERAAETHYYREPTAACHVAPSSSAASRPPFRSRDGARRGRAKASSRGGQRGGFGSWKEGEVESQLEVLETCKSGRGRTNQAAA